MHMVADRDRSAVISPSFSRPASLFEVSFIDRGSHSFSRIRQFECSHAARPPRVKSAGFSGSRPCERQFFSTGIHASKVPPKSNGAGRVPVCI